MLISAMHFISIHFDDQTLRRTLRQVLSLLLTVMGRRVACWPPHWFEFFHSCLFALSISVVHIASQ